MKERTRLLWIDASAGASGDMLLGSLLDAGVPLRIVREAAAGLHLPGWRLSTRRVTRATLAARQVRVTVSGSERDDAHVHHGDRPGSGHGRTRRAIRSVLRRADLPRPVVRRAADAFDRLFDAEARAHGLPVDRVHLHEAGAVDALIDVVGVCAAVDHLGPRRIVVSPVSTGTGTVRCAHGTLPVPVPAVLDLLRGVPVTGDPLPGERLTPTGAALLVALADAWGPMPAMRPLAAGTGAGTRDDPERPNVVRVVLGEDLGDHASPTVVTLSCTLDDATPQVVAWALDRVREAGALDAFVTQVLMKKGRPGHQLTVLARPEDRERLSEILLEETGTLGLRWSVESRIELEREWVKVPTRWGRIRVKVGSWRGVRTNVWPEFEDCAAAARRHGVPIEKVQREALQALSRRGSA